MAKIAIMGYGTVGSGVAEGIYKNQSLIVKKTNEDVSVKWVLDIRDFPKNDPMHAQLTKHFEDILEDDDISVVVETMGGIEPAYTFVSQLLKKGKSVVTSNKELVAKHGSDLLSLAKENNVNFFFEASVGGGIPIIRAINKSFLGDQIVSITGILNGTTNYILTKMALQGRDFASVLLEAQELGYAEKNPEADVQGHDTCRKIAILSSLATGKQVDFNHIKTQGITEIDSKDIAYAKELHCVIKLLAQAKIKNDNLCAFVAPCLVQQNHILGRVDDVQNGVIIKGNLVGELIFLGHGAGKLPTASAVIADVLTAIQNKNHTLPCLWSSQPQTVSKNTENLVRKLIRVTYSNKELAQEAVKQLFEQATIVFLPNNKEEFAFISQGIPETQWNEKTQELLTKKGILSIVKTICLYEA